MKVFLKVLKWVAIILGGIIVLIIVVSAINRFIQRSQETKKTEAPITIQ